MEAPTTAADVWPDFIVQLHRDDREEVTRLARLAFAMSRHAEIKNLQPYISHGRLHLSRCNQQPYSEDCPHVVATGPRSFRAYAAIPHVVVKSSEERRWRQAEYELLGEGGVEEILEMIAAALPPRCSGAIEGDVHDLRYLEGKYVMPPIARELHLEAFRGRVEMAAFLLADCADVDAADYRGFTALMFAVLGNRPEMIRYLLSHGALVSARTLDGETAYSLALVTSKSPDILHALEAAGARY